MHKPTLLTFPAKKGKNREMIPSGRYTTASDDPRPKKNGIKTAFLFHTLFI